MFSVTIGYAKQHTKKLGTSDFWKGIVFKMASTLAALIFKKPINWDLQLKNHNNCALGDRFLIFGTVLGMVMRFSKIIASKLGAPPSGQFEFNSIIAISVYGSTPNN